MPASRDDAPELPSARAPGCLGAAAAALALVGLAPVAAATRAFQRWRRGRATTVQWETAISSDGADAGMARIDLRLDTPLGSETLARRALTDAMVRLGEALRDPDDVYHLVYREPSEREAVALGVGPQLQELGDRFALALTQPVLERRVLVWLTLPAAVPLGTLVDPAAFDPEATEAAEGLLAASAVRWGALSSYGRSAAAILYRVILIVPRDATLRVEAVCERLRRTFAEDCGNPA